MLPVVWLGDMTRLATELERWTAKLSLARLQQDAELPERAMEREIINSQQCFFSKGEKPAQPCLAGFLVLLMLIRAY